MDQKELSGIREIHVKIGVLSCVQPDLLRHVFKFVKEDSPFQQAELFTELVEVLVSCEDCGQNFKVENYKFVCPTCGKPSAAIIEGNELQIHKIISEEPAHEEINQ